MKLLFWFSLSLILFAYAGYPICVYLRARYWARPVRRKGIFPRVTIILAVHNEERNLLRKLDNLAALDYPADLLEVIVVSDGSTDQTNQILAAWQRPASGAAVILPEHRGKANALNFGIAEARGEIICFTDARQIIQADGLKNLVANFADPSIGCVSGELILRKGNAVSSEGLGLYWQLEKKVRNWEGLAGSTVGVTGAFYAIRKELLTHIPRGTILDDVFIPLQVALQGRRVIFDASAVVWDDFTPSLNKEFHRKVRTLVGNYQLLQLAPWVLTTSNPVRIQMICHKLLRLMVPFALVGALVSTFWLRESVYELAFMLQIIFYALAGSTMLGVKIGFLSRLSNLILTFLVLNTAAAVAFVLFVTGKKVAWAR